MNNQRVNNYYIDFRSNVVLKNIDETRFKCSDKFDDYKTHFIKLNEDQIEYYKKYPDEHVQNIWFMNEDIYINNIEENNIEQYYE